MYTSLHEKDQFPAAISIQNPDVDIHLIRARECRIIARRMIEIARGNPTVKDPHKLIRLAWVLYKDAAEHEYMAHRLLKRKKDAPVHDVKKE